MSETRSSRVRALGLAAIGYLLLTIGLTWPAAVRFSQEVAGFEALDSVQYTWSLWWSGYAWEHLGQSPAQVTLMYQPWGGEHVMLDLTLLLDWLAFPLARWLTPTEVYNTLFLASFFLSGLAMYALALEVTDQPLAAFLAGVIFTFAPGRMGHALRGHLTHINGWLFPLFLLFLLRTIRRPTWHTALFGGLCLGAALLLSLVTTAYGAAPLTVLVLGYLLATRRRSITRRHLLAVGLLLGIAALIALPWYGPFLWRSLQENTDLSAGGVQKYSADLFALLLPSPFHPLWGSLVSRIDGLRRVIPDPNDLEGLAFLGWLPLALGASAVARRQQGIGLWLFLAVATLWLSLGPVLRIGGASTGLRQPYLLVSKLPFYTWGRTPERFNQLTMLALGVLAAQGLAGLRWPTIGKMALIGLIVVELMVLWPYPDGTPLPPAQLAAWRDEPGTVLNLPIKKGQISNLAMYYQTAHQRPIVGGYIHRELPGMRSYVKAIDAALTEQDPDAQRPLTPEEIRGLLSGLNVRHVLLHRQFVDEAWFAGVQARLMAALGPAAQDIGTALVYDVPPTAGEMPAVAEFGKDLQLLQVDLAPEARPGDSVAVRCEWLAAKRPADDYAIFVHLLNSRGERIAQHDGLPLGGNWPTIRWAPGERVTDVHELVLPAFLPPGNYSLAIGLYPRSTGQRLPVNIGGRPAQDDVYLIADALRVH